MSEEVSAGARRVGESRRTKRGDSDALPAQLPDLSDFMTDRFFFGDAVRYPPKPSTRNKDVSEISRPTTTQTPTPNPNPNPNPKPLSNTRNSRRTQEWLEEARQIVASSPTRRTVDENAAIVSNNPSRSLLQRNDKLSASGRRNPFEPKFSSSGGNAEAYYYSAPNSFTSDPENAKNGSRSQSDVHQWFAIATILSKGPSDSISEDMNSARSSKPPRLLRNQGNESLQQTNTRKKGNESVTLRDVLKSPKAKDPHTTTPNLKEKSEKNERASVGLLSPPRRSISGPLQSRHVSQTPSIAPKPSAGNLGVASLNEFLRKQRAMIASGPATGREIKFIFSASESTTSSMVAAICYAWMLGNSAAPPEGVAVPVVNVKRREMWRNRQAAWLFHYVGIDGRALLFSDEVDIKKLAHPRRHKIIVIGQDEFNTTNNTEVVSPCTLLVDRYYQQSYELLEAQYLRKLLLAGVLLDTKILYERTKQKDAQIIDLLLIGESPSYKNNFLSLLNQKHTDESFEEVLQYNYGEPLANGKSEAPPASSSNGKNIFTQTFSRWFGLGSK